jgi:3-hydroxy acid dehydrogenase/malonic semialdehyde reductase
VYDMIQTNVTSALHLVRTIAPKMVSRKCGHIIMIGSVSGLHPIQQSVYGATKGAIHMLCQNLRIELLGTGIRITEICPGRVKTDFFKTAFGEKTSEKLMNRFEPLEPTDICDAILHAIEAPQRVNITTIEMTATDQAIGGLQSRDAEHAYK